MKKLFSIANIVLFFLAFTNVSAQLAEDSWAFGIGGTYPRFINHNLTAAADENYGAFLSLQRNFSEHVALRLSGRYMQLRGKYGTPEQIAKTVSYHGNLDVLYYFVPCESVSPFITIGLGGNYFQLFDKPDPTLDESYFDFQLNAGIGIEWDIGEEWEIKTEFGYYTLTDNKFDGMSGASTAGGIFGGPNDTYMTADIGFIYYFEKGKPSKYCQLYSGITAGGVASESIDYDRIEEIVQRHIPEVIETQVVVETSAESARWVLVGVNFDFNSARLKSEAYPILLHAVQALLRNPDTRVEIQGYTDNIGSERYNQTLSERRARTVQNYLVARGVKAERLEIVGYGESKPIADNSTPAGRAMNRRIEFKFLN
ncbi:OmpA family protein [Bacteroidota bacterium]